MVGSGSDNEDRLENTGGAVPPPSESLPSVTVVMPIRNEADFIAESLGAVLQQDYPADKLAVLVVDGMSIDGTREAVKAVAACRPDVFLRILDNPMRSAASALNIGLNVAQGEVVARVDGHCVPKKDYLRAAVLALRDPSVGCVGGPVETIGVNKTGQVIALAMSSKFGVGGSQFRTNGAAGGGSRCFVDTVPFPAFRKTTLRHAGPFDEELRRNQDDEYSYRLRALGYRILLEPGMKSRYYGRDSLQALVVQYFEYGLWKVRVLQLHPRQMMLRQFVPGLFLATVVVFAAASPTKLLPAVVGLYAVANLAASLQVGLGRGWRTVLGLPWTFAVLHCSYGAGFLTGLGRFWRRWRGERRQSTGRPYESARDP